MSGTGFKRSLLSLCLVACALMTGCGAHRFDAQLAANTQVVLIDWHITGFWVINCPVAWVKVTNNNHVPIKDLVLQYNTFDAVGNPLDEGTFDLEGTIHPGETKNFIELYLGLVSLYSDRLSIKLISVSEAGR